MPEWAISGTPTVAHSGTIRIRAANSQGEDFWTVDFTTTAPPGPSWADDTGDHQDWVVGSAILPITVPAATGNPIYNFAYLPLGISFDANTRIISGTPTVAHSGTIRIRAANSQGEGFWTVDFTTAAPPGPSWADDTGDHQDWVVGSMILPITVPEATGNPIYNFAYLPLGISFDANTRIISGTPTVAQSGTIRIRAANSQGEGFWTVDFTTAAPPGPNWADDTGDHQDWTQYSAILPITVPAATGNPIYNFAYLPLGIDFDINTRVISGTPTVAHSGTIRIRAANSQGEDFWTVSFATAAAAAPGIPIYRYQVTAIFSDDGQESLPGLSGDEIENCKVAVGETTSVIKVHHGLFKGDLVEAYGFTEAVYLNNRQFTVDAVLANSFQLAGLDSTDKTPETTGGTIRRAYISVTVEGILSENNKIVINWPALSGAFEYAVYRLENGSYSFMGQTLDTSFVDNGSIVPNFERVVATSTDLEIKGNPAACGYHEQRRFFGGSDQTPDTFVASRIGDQNVFTSRGSFRADGPIKATLAGDKVQDIEHFVSREDLIILTSGSEWRVGAGPDSEFSADTIRQRPQSFIGASPMRPLQTNQSIVFEKVNGGGLYEAQFSLEKDGYASRELTLLSRHLFKRQKGVDIASQINPDSLIFVSTDSGIINVLSYYPDQEVLAWTRWETDGKYESLTTVPNKDTGEDDVYVIVKRFLNGGTVPVRYIERFDQRKFEKISDCYFVDCGITYDGAPVSVVSGLSHLAGRDVSVLADGGVVEGVTVSATGSITLPSNGPNPRTASKIHVGLPYKSTVKTLNPDDTRKTEHGRRKKVNSVSLQLYQTKGIHTGRNENELEELKQNIDLADDELFTGEEFIRIGGDWGTDASIYIEQSDPLPMSILAVTPDTETGDVQ